MWGTTLFSYIGDLHWKWVLESFQLEVPIATRSSQLTGNIFLEIHLNKCLFSIELCFLIVHDIFFFIFFICGGFCHTLK